ncbi:MAG: response regulator [Candidatus Lernaella stagnicola]|nr:response regulator [Candidatus Lernaella stagnicola]
MGDKPSVLIIEDESMLATLLHRMIERLGRSAAVATNGSDATDALESRGREIDLIILDYRLPDSLCHEMIERCRRLAPNAKLVLTSGYPLGSMENVVPEDLDGFLPKPFNFTSVKALLEKLFT